MAMWQPEIETMPRKELRALQSERLRWQVSRMYEKVELFRKRMDEAGLVPEDIKEFKLPKKLTLPEIPSWMALYIGKGKRDKISRGDIAGFLMKKAQLRREDVGAIALFERYAYVAVKRSAAREAIKLLNGEKIKGLKTVVEPVRG